MTDYADYTRTANAAVAEGLQQTTEIKLAATEVLKSASPPTCQLGARERYRAPAAEPAGSDGSTTLVECPTLYPLA